MLARGQAIVAPGAYDPIGARVVEALGFPAVYVAGFMVAAHLGLPEPHLGLDDLLAVAGRVADAVEIPVICDAGSGYGADRKAIQDCIRAFERSGVAGVHIEDEAYPRPSPDVRGRQRVLDLEAFQERLRWAIEARRDTDLVIMARTDVLAARAGGREEVVRRGRMAAAAGASAFAVKGMTSREDLAWLRQAAPGIPLLAWAGKHPISTQEYTRLGVQIVAYALAPITTATGALWDNYAALKATGLPGVGPEVMLQQREMVFELVGMDETGAERPKRPRGQGDPPRQVSS